MRASRLEHLGWSELLQRWRGEAIAHADDIRLRVDVFLPGPGPTDAAGEWSTCGWTSWYPGAGDHQPSFRAGMESHYAGFGRFSAPDSITHGEVAHQRSQRFVSRPDHLIEGPSAPIPGSSAVATNIGHRSVRIAASIAVADHFQEDFIG